MNAKILFFPNINRNVKEAINSMEQYKALVTEQIRLGDKIEAMRDRGFELEEIKELTEEYEDVCECINRLTHEMSLEVYKQFIKLRHSS